MRVFRNQNFMVTRFINLRNLYEGIFFLFSLEKIIIRYKRIGYNSLCDSLHVSFFNPIIVDNYAAFFNYTSVGRVSDSLVVST